MSSSGWGHRVEIGVAKIWGSQPENQKHWWHS